MKKVLQKTLFRLKALLLLVVMFVVGSSAAWAQDATYSLTVKSGSGRYTSSVDENGLQYSYYSWNSKANTYGNGNIIWFSSPDKPISKIVFTYASGQGDVYPSSTDNYPWSDLGTFDQSSYTWTAPAGGATYVSFRGIDDIYFTSADVWFDGSSDDGSVKATLSFAGTLNSYYNESGVQTSLGGGDNFYGGGYFLFDNGAKMTFNTSGSNGWSNSAQRIRISSGCSFTVSAPEGYELTAIDFTTDGTNSLAGLSTTSGLTKQSNQKATWAGKADNVVFTTNDITFITTMKVTLMPVVEEGEITYTINLVDAPTGAYVILDDQRFESSDTYTVEKNLGKNDLEAYEPDGYYAEVEYTRDNHTYTVTYKAYNYYDVTVTGTEDPAAGVVYNNQTYGNGVRIETKDVLTESSVTAAEVSGLKGTVSLTGNTYNVDYQEKLDFVIMTNTNQTSYYNSEYDVTVTCLATWSNCLNFWRSADLTVESSTFLISRVEFEELYGATISGTSSYGNISNNVWEGTPSNNITFSTTSGDYRVKKLHIYLARPQVSTYTINLVDAPAGASVLVNDDKTVTTASDTYTTTAVLNENNVVVTCPETHYYEKTYDEDTHTFTVTFNEYYHYAVSVTGCTDATAGVRYDNRTYGNEETIQAREPLTDSDVTAVTVNGYTAAAPVVGTLDGHNATISVVYAEASEIEYTVTITGMPAGASVMIEDEEFFASGTHKSRKTLDAYDASVKNCPETHYTNDQYQWYDEDSQTFNITFSEYLAYTIAIDEASAYNGAEAGVKVYNDKTYVLGQPIYNKTALTENDVKAIEVNGFTGTVSLAGNVFTVSYTKNEFITFDADKFSTGEWGSGDFDETIENVRLQGYDGGPYFNVNDRSNSHITLTSSVAPIVKVELEYISWGKPSLGYATVDAYNQGNGISTTDDITTWTGSTKSLELWQSVDNYSYVSSIKVYLAKATTYHVNIGGMPAQGANVVVNNDYINGYYTEDGNYDYVTYDELNESDIIANTPKSHAVEKSYDSSSNTFTVTYTERQKYEYSVNISPADDENLKIRINGDEYGNSGEDKYTFYEVLTFENIEAPDYDGYYANPSVTLDNESNTITVEYTPLPTLAIGTNARDNEGNYWTTFSFEKPFSLPEDYTPCIVTGVENGVLELQEFEAVNNQVSTLFDFAAKTVNVFGNSLVCDEGNNGVTMTKIGGTVYTSDYGGYLTGSSSFTITIDAPAGEKLSKVVVTPYGYGSYGANMTFDDVTVSGDQSDADAPYTYNTDASSCTILFNKLSNGYDIYISKIEIVVGENNIPVIPANTGILVKSSESASKIPFTICEESVETVDVAGNLLVAGCDPTAVWSDESKLFYKLSWKNSSYEDLGFYWGVEGGHSITPSKNKAYLVLDAANASNFRYLIGGEEEGTLTAIDGVVETEDVANIYDLQGKRVVAPKAGVYVKNGKKFIVK